MKALVTGAVGLVCGCLSDGLGQLYAILRPFNCVCQDLAAGRL
jgi:hypothetical protein